MGGNRTLAVQGNSRMQTPLQSRRAGVLLSVIFGTLPSCAMTDYQPSSFELIVEGNEASYAAFEEAAKACGYTAFWRFPGATVQGVTVGSHYNLSRVSTPKARCATSWVDQHPETGLRISGH